METKGLGLGGIANKVGIRKSFTQSARRTQRAQRRETLAGGGTEDAESTEEQRRNNGERLDLRDGREWPRWRWPTDAVRVGTPARARNRIYELDLGHAAVYEELDAGDEAAVIRGEEGDGFGDFV